MIKCKQLRLEEISRGHFKLVSLELYLGTLFPVV